MHLTAREAGRVATEAGARRLVLTHVLGSLDRNRSLAEAQQTYAGDLALAEDLRSWLLI
jgi:ribonuclease BN (tRNA processing enzyme)